MKTKTIDNKKIARELIEAFEKKDYGMLEELTDTKNFKLNIGNAKSLNYEESMVMNKGYNSAFPDLKITLENQIAEDDYVVSRVTYEGTHKGELLGMPASGKKIKITGITIQQIANGKIVEAWDEFDALGMLQQLGAIPDVETAQV